MPQPFNFKRWLILRWKLIVSAIAFILGLGIMSFEVDVIELWDRIFPKGISNPTQVVSIMTNCGDIITDSGTHTGDNRCGEQVRYVQGPQGPQGPTGLPGQSVKYTQEVTVTRLVYVTVEPIRHPTSSATSTPASLLTKTTTSKPTFAEIKSPTHASTNTPTNARVLTAVAMSPSSISLPTLVPTTVSVDHPTSPSSPAATSLPTVGGTSTDIATPTFTSQPALEPTDDSTNTPTTTSADQSTAIPVNTITPTDTSTPTSMPRDTVTTTPSTKAASTPTGTSTSTPRDTVTTTPSVAATSTSMSTPTPTCIPNQPRKVDVIFVLDISHSMEGQKIDDAKRAAKAFVSHMLTGDQIGLVGFAATAELVQPLTHERNTINAAIDGITLRSGTNIGAGITMADAELTSMRHDSAASPVMVVLTDGRNNQGDSPQEAADVARSHHIRVIVIGLGGDADQDMLRSMASSLDDYHFVESSSELEDVYVSIADTVHSCASPTPVSATSTLTSSVTTTIETATSTTTSTATATLTEAATSRLTSTATTTPTGTATSIPTSTATTTTGTVMPAETVPPLQDTVSKP